MFGHWQLESAPIAETLEAKSERPGFHELLAKYNRSWVGWPATLYNLTACQRPIVTTNLAIRRTLLERILLVCRREALDFGTASNVSPSWLRRRSGIN